MSPSPRATISAQPGPQTEFLRSTADICIYGGAAGGGKTVGLILEPLRHVSRVANFTAVFFRRTTPQITNPGALWDESLDFYPRVGGTPHLGVHEWRWPHGLDNPALLRVNPDYLAWLLSLPLLERERLLGGNWKIRPAAGLYFKREWCAVVDQIPADLDIVRYWDLAATEKTELNDPDWTVGVK